MKKLLILLAISMLPACNDSSKGMVDSIYNPIKSSEGVKKMMGYQCNQLNDLYTKNSHLKLAGKLSYIDRINEGNEENCQNSIKMLNLDIKGKCTNTTGGTSFGCNNL